MRNVVLILLFSALSTICFAQTSTSEEGLATFYSNNFIGRKTSNGEVYKHTKLTAAHPSLPFGTEIKVTNLRNGRSVIVKVNDRCSPKRIIVDLSKAAASKIDMIGAGIQKVKLEVVTDSIRQAYIAQEISMDSTGVDSLSIKSKAITGFKSSYSIQVASIASKVKADRMVVELNESYKQYSKHRRVTIKGKPIYKVIVGTFGTKEDAQPFLEVVKKSYPSAFIVSLK